MLADLMTFATIMNSSSMPIWNNLDNYAETLLSYSYLAARDTLMSIYGLGSGGGDSVVC
jgi:hypothetical protein